MPDDIVFFCPNCGVQITLAYHLSHARLNCPQCPCALDASWHSTGKAGHLTVSAFTDAPLAVVRGRSAEAEKPLTGGGLLYAAA